jgi:hypothetical protein
MLSTGSFAVGEARSFFLQFEKTVCVHPSSASRQTAFSWKVREVSCVHASTVFSMNGFSFLNGFRADKHPLTLSISKCVISVLRPFVKLRAIEYA